MAPEPEAEPEPAFRPRGRTVPRRRREFYPLNWPILPGDEFTEFDGENWLLKYSPDRLSTLVRLHTAAASTSRPTPSMHEKIEARTAELDGLSFDAELNGMAELG